MCVRRWVSFKYLVLPRFEINLVLQKDVLNTLVLLPPCTKSGLGLLQFESCVVMQYLDLIRTTK